MSEFTPQEIAFALRMTADAADEDDVNGHVIVLSQTLREAADVIEALLAELSEGVWHESPN